MTDEIVLGAQMYPAWQACADVPGGYAARLPEMLRGHAAAGFAAWETGLEDDADAARHAALLAETGLRLPSIYVGARVHTPAWREGMERIVAAARRARPLGATIVTCNPDPVRWGGPENKSDGELRTQASALQAAGEALAAEGMTLAYHWHDPEFRCGAREVWHMLLNTDPAVVGVCFDTHWAYRGAGNSEEAMFDLLRFTLPRIVSFHVRQSRDGVWSECFGEGDIDYRRWAECLQRAGWRGPVLLEQVREEGTPRTMTFLEAQAAGLRHLRGLLA